jgi:hypothetical protein
LKEGLFDLKPLDVFVQIISSSSPEIIIDSEIFVCENTELSYLFNITDEGGADSLIPFFEESIPFYLECDNNYGNILGCEIESGTLNKTDVLNPGLRNPDASYTLRSSGPGGIYPQIVSVTDEVIEGDEYVISAKLSDITPSEEGGMVVFAKTFTWSIPILIQEPLIVTEKGEINIWWILLVILIIIMIIVVIIIYFIFRGRRG